MITQKEINKIKVFFNKNGYAVLKKSVPKRIINEIQRKQVLKIKEWTDAHPNYCEDNELYVEYQKLVKLWVFR